MQSLIFRNRFGWISPLYPRLNLLCIQIVLTLCDRRVVIKVLIFLRQVSFIYRVRCILINYSHRRLSLLQISWLSSTWVDINTSVSWIVYRVSICTLFPIEQFAKIFCLSTGQLSLHIKRRNTFDFKSLIEHVVFIIHISDDCLNFSRSILLL